MVELAVQAVDPVDRLTAYIARHWGIRLDERKRTLLYSRLQRRMRELELPTLEDYCRYLFEGGGIERDHQRLCDAITTQTTSFFREAQHFDHLTRSYLPQLFTGRRTQRPTFRAWSAAASIGAEAYTLAMVLDDWSRRALSGLQFQILATDVNRPALRQIQDAVYALAEARSIPPALRARYLLRGKGERSNTVRIVRHLRERVTPRHLNLMETPYRLPADFDLILMRNCLIYFDAATQLHVARALRDHLRPGGLLITGHSEHLAAADLQMEVLQPSVYRRTR